MKMQYLQATKTKLIICLICSVYLCQQVSAEVKDVPYTTNWELNDRGNYKERWWTQEMSNLPQIVWQTYQEEIYPLEAVWRALSWMRYNPQHSYRHISDLDFANTVLAYFHPNYHDQLLNHLTSHKGRMSDFFRFTTLYLFGGIYCDIDCYPFKQFREWDHYPFNEVGVLFSGEGFFMEQYLIIAQPRHPLIGQFLTIFLDTAKHDKKMLHGDHPIEEGGPGMWLLALYDICEMNPLDKDVYVDEMLHDGRGRDGWVLGEHPSFVFQNYKNRESKLRKCCDYYNIELVDENHWGKWPFIHNKRNTNWRDGYVVHSDKDKLRIPVLKDVLVYANMYSDEYRYRKDREGQLTNQQDQLECQAQLVYGAYETAYIKDPTIKTAAINESCDSYIYGAIGQSNVDPKSRLYSQSQTKQTRLLLEQQYQRGINIEILDLLAATVPWIHLVAVLFFVRAFQLRQKTKNLKYVPYDMIQTYSED